jgi:hypothetical protein
MAHGGRHVTTGDVYKCDEARCDNKLVECLQRME